jgi:putative sigma-54 modulation protein
MNVSYRGMERQLPPKIQEKLDAKFAKLSKMLEKNGEKEAHVVITNTRHLHKAEISIQFYDHQLVGIGSDGDLFTALSAAIDKLEKQAVKHRTKWLENKRTPVKAARAAAAPAEEAPAAPPAKAEKTKTAAPSGSRIFRVNHHERRKPITLDEAVLEMEDGREYLVYRDADKECVSVLVRRRDGNFDLIES